jgi:hypothetical protein
MSTCLLSRVRRFRGQNPEVLESGSLRSHRQKNSEVLRKFSEVSESVRTEPRRKARLSTNMFARQNTRLQVRNHSIMPRRNLSPNKNKAHASRDIPPSYVLRCNNLGKVVATYVGNESNIYVKRSLWVPKVLVANMEGPKSSWGPKRRN